MKNNLTEYNKKTISDSSCTNSLHEKIKNNVNSNRIVK